MVCEADESDGTFLKLPADVAVVTNIDPEHLDHYGNFEAVKKAFRDFVENVPFYGFGVCCIDHPEVQAMVSKITDRRVVTYGENRQSDVRFSNLEIDGPKSRFDVDIRDRKSGETIHIAGLELPMAGKHNVANATAAIAVAYQLGVDADGIRKGISAFSGVKRRFTHTGSWNGVEVFDDYAHHPVEITAVLHAARAATKGKVIAIKQPHRFTRLESLFGDFCACFNDADVVLVAPVYKAGEAPIDGIDEHALVRGLRAAGHRNATAISGPQDIAVKVAEIAEPGDFVVFLGAGDITKWAYELPKELAALGKK
jgi:UDP-N-acetylmuramate--alanine ligase